MLEVSQVGKEYPVPGGTLTILSGVSCRFERGGGTRKPIADDEHVKFPSP